MRQQTPRYERRLLLVVDQFEQIFTQCPDDRQRQAFITALHAAASARHGPDHTSAALVVIGVRADFEARCANYPQLAGAVQDRYLVTGMTERQLRLAITEPAKTAGSQVDGDLVETLLTEMHAAQPRTAGPGDTATAITRTGPGLAVPDRARLSPWPTMNAPAASKGLSPTAPGAPTTISPPPSDPPPGRSSPGGRPSAPRESTPPIVPPERS